MQQLINITPNPVNKFFNTNLEGRDFIIGDLHGSFNLFERLLTEISFNPTKDRIFSVGDLIDRGPQSLDCLKLLYEPWFFSVIANHEVMMMHAMDQDTPWYNWRYANSWPANGGVWGLKGLVPTHDEEAYEIWQLGKERLQTLPWVINLQTKTGFIHIIHAEFPCIGYLTDEMLTDPNEIERMIWMSQTREQNNMIWSRPRFDWAYRTELTDEFLSKAKDMLVKNGHVGGSESLIISGHTIVQKPLMINNFLNIDTGAYKAMDVDWAGLTCYDVDADELITIHKDRVSRNVKPVKITA